jgi:hypothetical protein
LYLLGAALIQIATLLLEKPGRFAGGGDYFLI